MEAMNPNVLSHVVDGILKKIYQAANNYKLTELTEIIAKNMMITKTADKWVGFRGEYYSITTKLPQGMPTLLDRSLRSRMKKYLKHCENIEAEQQLVRSYIIQVCLKVRYREELLQYFPEQVHPTIKKTLHFFPKIDSIDAKPLRGDAQLAFQKKYEPYLEVMRSRLVINLLGG